MLYFFYGAETFQMRRKINLVIENYKTKHKSGLNFGRFDLAREGEIEKLKIFLNAYSMFAEKKLAVAENALQTSEVLGDILSGLAQDKERFLFLYQELALNEDRKKGGKYVFKNKNTGEAFEKLKKKAESEEFDFLSGIKLENWIKKEVQKNGLQAEPAAIKKLLTFVGPDLWRMNNEIEKLASYKQGKAIMLQDVDLLIGAKIENDIFKTVDALANRQKNLAFKLLHQHLEQGESEIYLLSMLAYQFRNLLLVKDQIERGIPFYNLQSKLKLHPFVLRKSFDQSKNFSLGALKKIYERLAEIDINIKSGQIEPRVALDLVVQEIAG